MIKKIAGVALATAVAFGGALAVQPHEKAYAWDQGTSYKTVSGGATIYTGTDYPSDYGTTSDISFYANWTNTANLTFQLQYYGPYGTGWLNSGSAWSSSTGSTSKTFTGLTGNYQYRVKITNNSSVGSTFNGLYLK
jgi:hypothetical protein